MVEVEKEVKKVVSLDAVTVPKAWLTFSSHWQLAFKLYDCEEEAKEKWKELFGLAENCLSQHIQEMLLMLCKQTGQSEQTISDSKEEGNWGEMVSLLTKAVRVNIEESSAVVLSHRSIWTLYLQTTFQLDATVFVHDLLPKLEREIARIKEEVGTLIDADYSRILSLYDHVMETELHWIQFHKETAKQIEKSVPPDAEDQ
jgi:hypothetical protein